MTEKMKLQLLKLLDQLDTNDLQVVECMALLLRLPPEARAELRTAIQKKLASYPTAP